MKFEGGMKGTLSSDKLRKTVERSGELNGSCGVLIELYRSKGPSSEPRIGGAFAGEVRAFWLVGHKVVVGFSSLGTEIGPKKCCFETIELLHLFFLVSITTAYSLHKRLYQLDVSRKNDPTTVGYRHDASRRNDPPTV